MNFKKILMSFVALLFSVSMIAQDVSMSGQVLDEKGNGVSGATVSIKGSSIATTTDAAGNYSITIPAANIPAMVMFSSIGFGKQEYKIDGKMTSMSMSPKMKAESVNMGDVVVSASKKSEKILDAPASVAVLGEEKIKTTPALTVVDQLKKIGAVDIMPTGLVSNNVNVRGFNGIFSGSLLYSIDNRFASVPSLKVNAFQLVPTASSDIQKMELVRGPASALYGPNAANGVLAVYTKNPLDMKHRAEVTIAMTGGIRAAGDSALAGGPVSDNFSDRYILSPEIRIAAKITDKIGMKISASVMDANDFEQYDSREVKPGSKLYFGENKYGGQYKVIDSVNSFTRDFKIKKQTGDVRFDYRHSDKLSFTLSGGVSKASNFELTGLGGAQAKNWLSYNTQLQMKMGRLFAQVFMNASESGNTFLIPQGNSNKSTYLEDLSKQIVAQLQHSSSLMSNKLGLVYGIDYIKTLPNSFGTIYGRFDSSADMTQYGAYVQGDYKVSDKINVVAALRGDYHDKIQEFMLSPKAAIVYKHNANNAFRITYNRAFSTPSVLNLSLDLANGALPNGVAIRGLGNPSGLQYMKGANGNAQFKDAFTGQWKDFNTTNNVAANAAHFEIIKNALAAQFAAYIPANFVAAFKAVLFAGVSMDSVDRAAIDLPTYAQTGNFTNSKIDATKVTDKESVKSTVTQTIEGGYKGFLGNKLKIGLDIYGSRTENFVSPLTTSSYSVMFDQNQYLGKILAKLGANIQALSGLSPQAVPLLNSVLDKNPANGGNNNGTSVDELASILGKLNVGLNMGTIAPQNGFSGKDVILTYVNLGTVDVFGADLSMNYQVTDKLTIDGAASHVNKDRIDYVGAANGYIGLNAPKWKSSLGFTHSFGLKKDKASNITWGANWRWYDAFPANSAIYVGTVNAVNLVDASVTWKPLSSMQNTFITLSMNNMLDTKHQFFPGTPYMGRTTFVKLSHTFIRK
jgi:outer membrane receptor for ferrienterochelin and colicins